MSTAEPVALRLMEREFHIACAPEERKELLEVCAFLDHKMRELRANAKAPGFDRLIVLAAISITHEYLLLRKQHHETDYNVTDELATLRDKLEAALEVYVK